MLSFNFTYSTDMLTLVDVGTRAEYVSMINVYKQH